MGKVLMVNDMIGITDSFESKLLTLFGIAQEAKENAYCRYSGFKVGAAVLANDRRIITGCNVENAVSGMTMCAERVAIFKAVAQGYAPGSIQAVAIASTGKNFSPCGACREVLNEFRVGAVVFEFDDEIVIARLSHLLPFGSDLSRAR